MALKKAKVTLGGVALAATGGIAWRFVSGVQPYTAVFTVHTSGWERLKSQMGQPLQLVISDSRGVETTIEQVYILHIAPSDSPHRVSFVVADKRWKWGYKLVVRDFNMPRKTGDRTAKNTVPIETQQVFDSYWFLSYSLKGDQGELWSAQDCVKEVIEILEGEGAASGGYVVDSFPIKDTGGSNTGEFTIQGVTLRDQGDVALARMLSYVPGADVYINAQGQAVIYDATDLDATEAHFQGLPVSLWTGENAAWVDRIQIRPEKVVVYYQREIELLLEYADDYRGFTSAQPVGSHPYIENVLPTVDPVTDISEYDPVAGSVVTKPVPPGTWVRVDKWLEAMDADRPEGSLPWNFKTIKRHWLKGDLEAVLGAKGLDLDAEANIAMRVQTLRQHFRQTFRVNRKYMERIRSLRSVRVGIIDPVSGARAPAAVWGQACIIPSTKGTYMAARGSDDKSKSKVYRNIDMLAPSRNTGVEVISTAPGPTRVNIIDEDLGVFRLEWIVSPYGTVESFLPCKLVNDQNYDGIAVTRDMRYQDGDPMGPGMQVEGGTNGIWLDPQLEYVVILTAVPCGPNNVRQFHKVEVDPGDVASIFRREFRIKDGKGPTLEVFVPPGEATARFALASQSEAFETVQDLFGLRNNASGEESGLEGPELPGYVLMNEDSHLTGHSTSLAAEMLTPYADNVQGSVVTRVPDSGLKLVGNMSGATIRVAAAPSAKVDAVHQFPGQQRQISRLAVMPESTRQIVLGIVPFKE